MQKTNLISPCGLNCGVCIAHLREKNVCAGCTEDGGYKAKSCMNCIIKNCENRRTLALSQCGSACPDFPCRRLKALAKRYLENYKVDLFDNLRHIETDGLDAFARADAVHWACPVCGATLSMHRDACLNCNTPYRAAKKANC